MKDFSTVIWIVVIAAAMIFNLVSQSRKQAKKQARQAGRHAESEAWPSWDQASAPQPAAEAGTHAQEAIQPAMTTTTRSTIAPSAGFEDTAPTADFEHHAHQSMRDSTKKGRMAAAEHPHTVHDDVQEGVLAEITEDFDLRKAVVYSEILKPKFDE